MTIDPPTYYDLARRFGRERAEAVDRAAADLLGRLAATLACHDDDDMDAAAVIAAELERDGYRIEPSAARWLAAWAAKGRRKRWPPATTAAGLMRCVLARAGLPPIALPPELRPTVRHEEEF